MTPTVPASPEDRNRTLTDMVVTCRERAGQSASQWHLANADRRPTTLHQDAQGTGGAGQGRGGGSHAVPSSQMRTLRLGEVARARARWEPGLSLHSALGFSAPVRL